MDKGRIIHHLLYLLEFNLIIIIFGENVGHKKYHGEKSHGNFPC